MQSSENKSQNNIYHTNHFSPRNNILLLLPIIVAIAGYLVFLTGDLFGDELATYWFSVLHKPSFFDPERASTSIPFLLSSKIGYLITNEPWGIRLSSVLFAAATVLVAGLLSKIVLGRESMILTMWLAAFSPILIEFGSEARPYAMMAFWGGAFFTIFYIFLNNENWKTSFSLGSIAVLSVFSRTLFAVNLIAAAIIYLVTRRKVTKYAFIAVTLSIPAIILSFFLLLDYKDIVPQVQSNSSGVSTLNFIFRGAQALTFGFNTFSLPELGKERNVPIFEILLNNRLVLLPILLALIGIAVGMLLTFQRKRKAFLYLMSSVLLPSAIIIIAGQLGYTIIREKFLVVVLVPYLVLLSGALNELRTVKFGWISIPSFTIVILISLYHYFFLPELYSRRMMSSDLNNKVIELSSKEDTIVIYHIPDTIKMLGPNYYTFPKDTNRFFDLGDEIKKGADLHNLIKQIEQSSEGRIFLVSREGVRNVIDPTGIVSSTLHFRRNSNIMPFGRNLKLVLFSKPTKINFQETSKKHDYK